MNLGAKQTVRQADSQGDNRETWVQYDVRRPGLGVCPVRPPGPLVDGWWLRRAPAVAVNVYTGLPTCQTPQTAHWLLHKSVKKRQLRLGLNIIWVQTHCGLFKLESYPRWFCSK